MLQGALPARIDETMMTIRVQAVEWHDAVRGARTVREAAAS